MENQSNFVIICTYISCVTDIKMTAGCEYSRSGFIFEKYQGPWIDKSQLINNILQ